MLFHLPIFLNWIQQCVASHVDDEGACENPAPSYDHPDAELRDCKICLLHDVIEAYWNQNISNLAFEAAMHKFWTAVFNDWAGLERRKRYELEGTQDPADFFPVLLTQLMDDAPEPL